MTNTIWQWLVYSACSSFVLLTAAGLAVIFCKQPVKRLRFIQWALIGCLMVPLVHQLPGLPGWHLGVLESPETQKANEPAESQPSSTELTAAPTPEVTHSEPITPAEQTGSEPENIQPATQVVRDTAPASIPTVAEPSPLHSVTSASTSASFDWLRCLLIAYAAIVGVLTMRWMIGFITLMQLQRHSRPASKFVRNELNSLAGENRLSRRVQVVISDRIDMPLTFGWRRPVILLPESVCLPGREDRLRYCLAHEWAHIQSRDILPWYLATLTQFLYFYQPVFWWLRRQMRLCQDFLADAFAADQLEMPEDYAEFLVQQTRKRQWRSHAAALSFVDKKSNLFRRITMLLQNQPLDRRCRKLWSLGVGLLAVGFLAGLVSVRLDAGMAAADSDSDTQPKKPVKNAEKPTAEKHKAITYTGIVVDRLTGKPLSDATVHIYRNLSSPPKGMEDFKRQTKVKTDANGKYAFTLAPDEVAQRSLYIEVDCHHPDYVAKGRSGYAHSMIQKNLKLGEPPFYSKIRLWPGKAVIGRVVSPDGKPVAGVEVLTYSKHSKSKRFDFGGFFKTKTDKAGRFRFVAATPGEGVYWITPKGFAPQAHIIPEARGKIDDVILQHGQKFHGRVLNAKGKPVAGVQVSARRNGDGEDVDRFLGQNAVANHIGRQATTNAKGEFQLDEVPPGTYNLQVRSTKTGWLHKPLKDVFVRQSVTLREAEVPAALEIRAVPHVEIHIKFLNSKGKITSGHRFHVFGRLDRSFYFAQSTKPDKKTGLGILRVPHGLTDTRINLMTNEHGVLRWRLKPGDALQNGRRIKLGTVESDLHGLEVVRYVAPILLVKAVDETGKQIKDFKPKGIYEKGKSPKDPNSQFINGVRGDIHFEKQPDGRWRSSQMLPDHNVTVIAEKDGFTTKPQVVSLKEKATKEIVFVLKRTGDKKSTVKGSVKRVDAKTQVAWINLGSAEKVTPRSVFGVFTKSSGEKKRGARKGTVEVTRVLGAHLSEVRIVKQQATNPIAAGDHIVPVPASAKK